MKNREREYLDLVLLCHVACHVALGGELVDVEAHDVDPRIGQAAVEVVRFEEVLQDDVGMAAVGKLGDHGGHPRAFCVRAGGTNTSARHERRGGGRRRQPLAAIQSCVRHDDGALLWKSRAQNTRRWRHFSIVGGNLAEKTARDHANHRE